MVQPDGLDHFLCYNIGGLSPLAEQVPFGLTPASVTLIDQFGQVTVVPQLPDRWCNPVNKVLPNGQAFPPANVNAHLMCFPFQAPAMRPVKVRVANQFGTAGLTAAPRKRLCLPSWKNDVQNPNAPGSVPVPVPVGTPPQPPGLDHFECYDVRYTGAPGFAGTPPSVTLVDQFGTRQANIGNPVELCNPVRKVLPTGQQFPPANPTAHLVCFQIATQPQERVIRAQNQFGTAQALITQPVVLCLPSFKRIVRPALDFDGDGDCDVSVYRPSTGTWYVQGGGPPVVWGASTDVPVPADYDGDGDADIAVYRPSTGQWFVMGGPFAVWGAGADVPVPADYDGDGDADIAVYRPSTGIWYVMGGPAVEWGSLRDVPVPADYDGDGDADITVYRPSTGMWFIMGGPFPVWGVSTDIPEPCDYSGDGSDDVTVFRPFTGSWFITGGPFPVWGASTDIALPLPAAVRLVYYP
ncbi:MAG: DUF7450 family protein [Acidimicrobiales bacterium]